MLSWTRLIYEKLATWQIHSQFFIGNLNSQCLQGIKIDEV